MQVGEVLCVRADDPAAEDDISRWASRTGHEVLSTAKDGAVVELSIKKAK